MTLEEVRKAKKAIEAKGRVATYDAVRQRLGRGSRRDIASFMQILRAQPPEEPSPVAGGDPVPDGLPLDRGPGPAQEPAAPVELDPVVLAEERLAAAEREFFAAREELLHAKVTLVATKNLVVENILHGSLHADDEVHRLAVHDVDIAKQDYDAAWQQRETARQALEQATQTHRRRHQEAWVAEHQPELVAQLFHWQEDTRTARDDRSFAHAKKELGAARMAYEQAVARAPWNQNGTYPHHVKE